MSRDVPDLLEDYLCEADAARDRHNRDLYPLRLLEITRQVRGAVPEARALLVDLEHRWERPIGPSVSAVRSHNTWSAITPPEWLRSYRDPQGVAWAMIVARIEQHFAYALGLDEPDSLGWHDEGDGGWRVDLLDPMAVRPLDSVQRAMFTGGVLEPPSPWVYLDFFVDNPDTGARYFARRGCRDCRGDGLVAAATRLPHGGDTDTCACVRRLPT
jgi:hypothetical protein